MLPRFALNDVPDSLIVNAIFLRQDTHGNAASRVAATDFLGLFGGQLGPRALLTAKATFGVRVRTVFVDAHHSAFARRIAHIVGVGSKKKMAWVLARRVVAMVKHAESGGNGAVSDAPSDTMSARIASSETKQSVAVSATTLPLPTLIRAANADFGPESVKVLRGQRRDATMCPSHDRLLIRRAWSGRCAA